MPWRFTAPLLWSLALPLACSAARKPKPHTLTFGSVRRVPFVAADAGRNDKEIETSSLRVRALFVDGKQREWIIGDTHDVTDRSFVVRRVLRVNDTLAGEKARRWVWQPGPWLLVDRVTHRITSLHLPDFDTTISSVAWYRDYAAYCGLRTTAKSTALSADVWQIGARRAALAKIIGPWPQLERVRPVCAPAVWQREPMRVTLRRADGDPLVYEVLGTSSQLVEEEGDSNDDN